MGVALRNKLPYQLPPPSPQNVMRACQVAIDYRTKFKKDVIVDLMCFRRW